MKILHVITTLEKGGAEKQLVILCRNQDAQDHEISVLPLKGNLELDKEFSSFKAQIFDDIRNRNFFIQILLYDVDIAINSNIYQFKYNCKNNEKYSRDNTGKFQKECINNCVNEMYKMKFIDFTPFHV